MTPKRAEEIRQEIINSGGWTSSATKEEDKEIMELWSKLDGRSTYYEAVCNLAMTEADEISPDDLEASADYWDRLIDPDTPSFLGGPEKCLNPTQSFNNHECFDCDKKNCPIGGDK